jgi:RimJ/RimL family protein N-acetyltransferase
MCPMCGTPIERSMGAVQPIRPKANEDPMTYELEPRPPSDLLALPDGAAMQIRALDGADRPGLAALFHRLSPESRRRRFLTPKRELTPRELAYLTDVDHVHHEALVAIDQRDGSIAGVGRYVRYADRPAVAEVAVEVADELQRMGIGTALVGRLVERARINEVERLTATTLWENRPARALLGRLGFRARGSHGGELDFELVLVPGRRSARSAE